MVQRDDDGAKGVPERFAIDFSGLTLLGRFEVLDKLDEGGMGSVYRGHDRELDAPVVVKVPHARLLTEPGFRERFDREVRDLVGLQHPHVVPALARGEHDGVPFFVLRYLGGGSLADRIQNAPDQRLALHDVAAWLPDVARTLDFMHRQGVIHRDVKPGNILFDDHGHVFLSDFGIAKALDQGGEGQTLTETGGSIGSPVYMAPEQWMARDLDGRADQYALAATVYEALGGRMPFRGSTAEILIRKNTEGPRHLGERAPDLSAAVADAVMRALSRDPAQRFTSCASFATAALDPAARARREAPTVLGTLETPAPTPGLRERLLAQPPWLLASAAGAVLLVFVLLLAGGGREGPEPTVTRHDVPHASTPEAGEEPPTGEHAARPPPAAAGVAKARKALDTHRYGDFVDAIYEVVKAGEKGIVPPDMMQIYTAMREHVVRVPGWASLEGDGPQRLAAARFGVEAGFETTPAEGTSPLRFLLVPPGIATLGSPAEEAGHGPDEALLSLRVDSPFWVQTTEITNAQFRAFRPGHRSGRYFGGASLDAPDQPAVRVGYEDALAFADWLTARDRRGFVYRLPTEAEWEYAARAGAAERFWWGDDVAFDPAAANLADRTAIEAWPRPARAVLGALEDDAPLRGFPVDVDAGVVTAAASSRGNPFGLRDVIGNTWEWCLDDPAAPTGGMHALRGGAFDDGPEAARLANRIVSREGGASFGFRLVATRADAAPVFAGRAASTPDPAAWRTALSETLSARDALSAAAADAAGRVKAARRSLEAAARETEARASARHALVRATREGDVLRWTAEVIDRRLLAEHGPASMAWRGEPEAEAITGVQALAERLRGVFASPELAEQAGAYELDVAPTRVQALPDDAALLRNALERAAVRLDLAVDGTYLLTARWGERYVAESGTWHPVEGGAVCLTALEPASPDGDANCEVTLLEGAKFALGAKAAATPFGRALAQSLRLQPLPAPEIVIDWPVAGSQYGKSDVRVAGTVEHVVDGATLTVNGVEVGLDGNRFEATLTLEDGADRSIVARYGGGPGIAQGEARTTVSIDTKPPVIEVQPAADVAVHAATGVHYSEARTLPVRALVRDSGEVALAKLVVDGRTLTPSLEKSAAGASFSYDVTLPADKRPQEIRIQAWDAAGHATDVLSFRAAYDPLMVLRVRFVKAMESDDLHAADQFEERIRTDHGAAVHAEHLERLEAWRKPPVITASGLEVWRMSGGDESTHMQGVFAVRRGGRGELRLRFRGLRPGDEVFVNDRAQELTAGQARGEIEVRLPLDDLRDSDTPAERVLDARVRVSYKRSVRFNYALVVWDASSPALKHLEGQDDFAATRLKTPYRLGPHPRAAFLVPVLQMLEKLGGFPLGDR